jgi:hypothetical protein
VPRKRQGTILAATPPDATTQGVVAGRIIRAQGWDNLVLASAQPGATALRWVVIHDPRSAAPWGLATNLPGSAWALWRRYCARWPIALAPLAAKQMLGAHRAVVFGRERRYRLPELAVLAGNIVAYVAATAAPVAPGLWDRHCRPTCGRWRRVLVQGHVSEIPVPTAALRNKASVTVHVLTGVQGHRRQKGSSSPQVNRFRQPKAA